MGRNSDRPRAESAPHERCHTPRVTVDQELAEPIDPAEVLASTPWGALGHAYGPADDVPEMLTGLTDPDEGVRSRALDHLHHVVHHQNTLYTSTAPAALYVAGILGDARSLRSVEKNLRNFPGPMRAELLGWLDSVANEADDEAAAISRCFGFPQRTTCRSSRSAASDRSSTVPRPRSSTTPTSTCARQPSPPASRCWTTRACFTTESSWPLSCGTFWPQARSGSTASGRSRP